MDPSAEPVLPSISTHDVAVDIAPEPQFDQPGTVENGKEASATLVSARKSRHQIPPLPVEQIRPSPVISYHRYRSEELILDSKYKKKKYRSYSENKFILFFW